MTSPPLATHDLDALRSILDVQNPVREIVWAGQPAFAKLRTGLRAHERFFLAVAPIIRRLIGRDMPFSPKRYLPDVPIEVQRLRALREAGWRVPEVLASSHDIFVTAHVGRTLEGLLGGEPDADARLAWLLDCARDLAAFHRAGQWHGAAQIRNVVRMPDGRLGRIDFETGLDTRFPVPQLQAFDATLFFTSLARTRDVGTLPAVAQAYLLDAPEKALLVLRRGHPMLRWLARSRIIGGLAPKEAERMRAIAALPFS
jgi:tRNA A-37 threonylcarbamoyl transferase component Bud32